MMKMSNKPILKIAAISIVLVMLISVIAPCIAVDSSANNTSSNRSEEFNTTMTMIPSPFYARQFPSDDTTSMYPYRHEPFDHEMPINEDRFLDPLATDDHFNHTKTLLEKASYSNAPPVEWIRTFGRSNWDCGYSVQQTSDGGYVLVGTTYTLSEGTPVSGDVYLIKTDSNGKKEWSKTFSKSIWNKGYSVQQTSDGGYIIAGCTMPYDTSHAWLIKTDSNGNKVWDKTFVDCWYGYSAQQTTDGGYIVAAHAQYCDPCLIKTDSKGNMVWKKIFDGFSNCVNTAPVSVQQTTDGGYIIVGTTNSYLGDGDWDWDAYLIKTDSNGNKQWSKPYGGSEWNWGYSVQQASDGGYIFAGRVVGDVWLVKTDSNGDIVWSKTFSEGSINMGHSVQHTSDGGYIIAGATFLGRGNMEVYLIKTDSTGHMEWSKTFGGNNWEGGYSVQQTSDGGYIITGSTTSYGANTGILLVKIKGERPPVLLVHGWQRKGGFKPSSELWKKMAERLTDDTVGSWVGDMKRFRGNGYVVYISNYTHDTTVGTHKDIRYYAKNLAEEIEVIKSEENTNKVDIVAHSMGGLVSRAYIESGDFGGDLYKNDVRNLIMLGTPNHGVFWAWLSLIIMPGWKAEHQMIPNCDFLSVLNHGCPKCKTGEDKINPKVEYYTIAGDRSWIGNSDGFISVNSVKLSNVRNFIYHVTHTELRTDDGVYQKVKEILLGDITLSHEKDPIPQQLPIISGIIYPSEEKSHEMLISTTTRVAFCLYWSEGDLNFTLVTPNGTLINTSTAESEGNITHFKDPELILDEYIIENPEQGIWKVNITAVNVSEEGENYTVLTLLETNITLSLSLQKYQHDPNEPINITANLTYGSEAITNASIIAKIQKPDDTTEYITLFDDGLHGDNQTNDGMYANTYTNTSLWGTYDITVTASGAINEEQFERETFTTVWIELYPDLTLSSSDISFSKDAPFAGDNVTINAAIYNIGDADAINASILFYDGDPINGTFIGEDIINVTAGGANNTTVSWTAKLGNYEIFVVISPYNEFLEENYTNNQGSKNILVSGCYVGAYLGCGSEDLNCENISDFNQKWGKDHAIFVRYVDISDSGNISHWEWAEKVKAAGAMPLFIYDPYDGLDNINIGDIEYFAMECENFESQMFIVFGHEMNGPWYPWGNDPANYTNKFKEVAEIFHQIAPKVEMCWVPNQNWGYPWGGTNYGDGYSEYYPEGMGTYGEYVDWVGLNFYEKDWDEDNLIPPDMFVANIRNGQNNTDFYEMFAVGKNKPMLIAEIGAFDPNKDPTAPGERNPLNETEQAEFKNEWLKQVYNVSSLKEEFPRLNAICYFHVNKTEPVIDTQSHSLCNIMADYRIPEIPNVYENLIADTYFIGGENVSAFCVDLSCNDTNKSIPSGGTAQYTITVKNTGNTPDTINLTLSPWPIPPCGWSYWLNRDNVTLPSGESSEVILYVSDGLAHPVGSYCVVTLTGTSQGDSTKSDSIETNTTIVVTAFDTGTPANPYPSIMGNHTGTIKPNHTVIATKLYTYPCVGTGGHTEYTRIWNKTWNATATWKGYVGDWHNITFDKTVVLLTNETYNYIIRTGSYPQIHHKPELPTENGWINCTEFVDANGKEYYNWIPAIRLE